MRSPLWFILLLIYSTSLFAVEDWAELKEKFVPGPNEIDFAEKLDFVDQLMTNRQRFFEKRAYLLYFNAATSSIGFSHMRLWIDGVTYEMAGHKDEGGNYLWKRSLIEGLLNKTNRPRLPSAIVEIPLTNQQISGMLRFLENERSSKVAYKFHNPSGAYNCMGIVYSALQSVGFKLPYLRFFQILPQQLVKLVMRHVSSVRVIGNGDGFIRAGEIPNHRFIQIPLSYFTYSCDLLFPGISQYFMGVR